MTWFDALVERSALAVDDDILESLNMRGVSDEQARQFRIGYLNRKLPSIDYPESFLKWSHYGDKLDGVYVFPLTNVLNEVHGLQFRHVDRERTGYMDYIEFKGEAVLFGLGAAAPHIWNTGRVTLVEGNFDLFPIQRHDPTTVATLTARVVEPLLWFLRRVCKCVVFGYDADETGRKGVANFRKFFHRDFEIHDLRFPRLPMVNGKLTKDPNELWELWGDIRFGEFLRQQTPQSMIGE